MKRNFNITVKGNKSIINITKDCEYWCVINHFTISELITIIKLSMNLNAPQRMIDKSITIIYTENTITLELTKKESPKTAYKIADDFMVWMIDYVENSLNTTKLINCLNTCLVNKSIRLGHGG